MEQRVLVLVAVGLLPGALTVQPTKAAPSGNRCTTPPGMWIWPVVANPGRQLSASYRLRSGGTTLRFPPSHTSVLRRPRAACRVSPETCTRPFRPTKVVWTK